MNRPPPSIWLSGWMGFALAALFFYPLAGSLEAEPFYLHWRPSHAWEAVVALAILTPVLGGLVWATWARMSRAGTLALALVAVIPLISLAAGVARQLSFEDRLWSTLDRLAIPPILAVAAIATFLFWPRVAGQVLRGVLVALSPIALVVVLTFVTSMRAAQVTATDVEARPGTGSCPSVLALLFDELSFSYLYNGTEIRAEFPHFKAFASAATNHLDARAPASWTRISTPSYLAARKFDDIYVVGDRLDYRVDSTRGPFTAVADDGLFGTARRAGFVGEAAGFYLPYCALLGSLVDRCRSFSFYNSATASEAFSPLHPIMTTMILWPTRFPLSMLKHPAYARMQRLHVAEALDFAVRPLEPSRATFRYVHFSIPHAPYVFDAEGYDPPWEPPWDPLQSIPDTGYAKQLRYTDRLFGTLLTRMRQSGTLDRTTIAVFTDHGFRWGGQEKDPLHVPFIVKAAGQAARVDVNVEERAEVLLRGLVERCEG